MSDRLVVQTQSNELSGFDFIKIKNRIDWLSGCFELTAFNRLSVDLTHVKSAVKQGDSVKLYKDKELYLTGYVDRVETFYAGQKKGFKIIGRSKAADLTDCSAFGMVYRSRNAPEIIADICQPFGIAVKTDLKGFARPDNFTVNPSETIGNALARLARRTNALLFSLADGSLCLTRRCMAKKTDLLLQSGKGGNLTGGETAFCAENEFSKVSLIGQGVLDDAHDIDAIRAPVLSAEFNDRRYRTRVVYADAVTDEALKKEIERLNKNSRVISLTAAGWFNIGLNILITARDEWLGLDGSYLVAGIEDVFDETGGHRTTFDLEAVNA